MSFMWSCSIDDVLMAMELAKSNGKKAGESYEAEFLFIMKQKGLKPMCETDLSYDEVISDFKDKGVKALDFKKLVQKFQEGSGENENQK